MARYHLKDNGEQALCPAQIQCRKGADAPHFEGSLEDARAWAEEQNAKALDTVAKPVRRSRFSRFGAQTDADKKRMAEKTAERERLMAEQERERQQRRAKSLPSAHTFSSKPSLSGYSADSYSAVDENLEVMDSMNPSASGVFEDYEAAKYRAMAPLSENITHYGETAGIPENEEVTIYRGVPDGVDSVSNGDFITTNKQLAESYGSKVLSMKVPAKYILDDRDEPLGDEYIYRIGE